MTATEGAARAVTRDETRGSFALWFGVLAAPAAWAVQLVVNYSLDEWFACSPASTSPGRVLGLTTGSIAVIVAAAAVVLSVVALVVSARCFRSGPPSEDAERWGRARWMALAGMMNSVLYLLLIVLSFGPPAFLDPCESGV